MTNKKSRPVGLICRKLPEAAGIGDRVLYGLTVCVWGGRESRQRSPVFAGENVRDCRKYGGCSHHIFRDYGDGDSGWRCGRDAGRKWTAKGGIDSG